MAPKKKRGIVETAVKPTETEKVIDVVSVEKMDLYASVEAQLNAEKIPAWRPDKDDPAQLIGEILTIDVAVGIGGAVCPIVLTVNTPEAGPRRVWCWHKVLQGEVIEARPQVGDMFGVVYGGRSTSASGREYVTYDVKVARNSTLGPQEIDYNQLALESGPLGGDEEPCVAGTTDGGDQPPNPATGGAMLSPDDDLPFAPSIA